MSKEASLYSLFLSMGPYSSGRPSDEKAMNTELTCLKGFTPKSFNDLVQMQVHGGYPIGEKGIEVESPFNSVLNHGADGTCALVLAVHWSQALRRHCHLAMDLIRVWKKYLYLEPCEHWHSASISTNL